MSNQMFQPNSSNQECPAKAYLARQPEGLTINGYRNWVAGYVTKSERHWEQCQQEFVSVLGEPNGQIAANALSNFVHSLGSCATCPLKCYAPNSGHLNSDECMLLGLIAALQHGDDEALQESINALSCLAKCSQILAPAGEYAMVMKSAGSLLLPIPAAVLAEIRAKNHFQEHITNYTIH
ncbi:MAG: hypothetical protein ABJ024_02580 [Lentilitoribacter sp.]